MADEELDLAEQARRRAEALREEKELILTRRTQSLAELCTKQKCWCGSDVVNPHSDFCDNMKRSVASYEEAKTNYSRIDGQDEAHAEALLEQEDKVKEENYLSPGQEMTNEVNDWTDMLKEAKSRDWDLSEPKEEVAEEVKEENEDTPLSK